MKETFSDIFITILQIIIFLTIVSSALAMLVLPILGLGAAIKYLFF